MEEDASVAGVPDRSRRSAMINSRRYGRLSILVAGCEFKKLTEGIQQQSTLFCFSNPTVLGPVVLVEWSAIKSRNRFSIIFSVSHRSQHELYHIYKCRTRAYVSRPCRWLLLTTTDD